ncbi:hypothetical protein C8A03DRAFT_44303 [Achaetomium macrosporum]|uniref:NAD-dependent epimerase/dehydratase domain-containing protein n=1 Tax=Achaetomium macrosporum TaxID=79813 RepID=A0AAN7HF61_9PEZI|nr:hypothetical protein C8A03DRAFT_44303 [Achaetomium macrosporum]
MPGRVLITGLNGYIATHTAAAFLRAGYSVRGTVRPSTPNVEAVVQALSKFHDGNRLEVVTVSDIGRDGAFDRAVEGTQAIAHLASPVSMAVEDPSEMMWAAVQGTTSLLASALAESRRESGKGVLKSVVFMSSISAIVDPISPPSHVFTEDDWNQYALAATRGQLRHGHTALKLGYLYYQASKVAAERAFWRFGRENKAPFSMVALCPAPVLGPPLYLPKSISNLSMRVKDIYDILRGGPIPESSPIRSAFVDVRDVAELVFNAVEKANATRTPPARYLVVGQSSVSPQEMANILREHYPERRRTIRQGDPDRTYDPEKTRTFDATKARKLLGRPWIRFRQSVLDSADVFLAAKKV